MVITYEGKDSVKKRTKANEEYDSTNVKIIRIFELKHSGNHEHLKKRFANKY